MDSLTIRIENRPDAVSDIPAEVSVIGKGLSIGRKAVNDLALPDESRFISGRHVSIEFDAGSYMLEDVSTNGTFINGSDKKLIGKHKLENGDKVRVGGYILAVELVANETALPQIKGAQGVQAPPTGGSTVQRPTTGIQQRQIPAATSAPGAQAPDFSRFQTGGKAAGVQRPGAMAFPPAAAAPAGQALIPDDFEDDLLDLISADPQPPKAETPIPADPEPETPEAQASPSFEPEPAAEPKAQVSPAVEPDLKPEAPADPSFPEADAKPEASQDDPFAIEAAPTPAPVSDPIPDIAPDLTPDSPPQYVSDPVTESGPFDLADAQPAPTPSSGRSPNAKPIPVVEKTDLTPAGMGERFAVTSPPEAAAPKPTPAPEPVVATAPEPEPTPAPEPATNALLEGFLEGAGIEDPDDLQFPLHELGVMLGRCARLGTEEMMQMLQDRSAVKLFVAQEDRTMRIASGNNPMKFMLDPDQAFQALFVKPRDGYQTGPDGFDNALADIRQHQAAMMAAIQPALADMLEGLAPSDVASDVGGGRLGGGARKSWEEYTKRWETRAAQGENGMLDAFLDAFSRRYNQALDTL